MLELVPWSIPALIMITISATYFFMDGAEHKLRIRMFVSAHGLLAALLYIGALAIWMLAGGYRPWAGLPFLLAHLIPLASIVYAFFRFKGPKLLHISQLANVVCMLYTLFVGAMAVTGDWL